MQTSHHAFAPTRWTLVLNAVQRGEQTQLALAELCRLYWAPLQAYVRRCGHDVHAAEDLTQEFFARLLAKQTLATVDPAKGKFRSFLLAALRHFLANEWDKTQAQKRGGNLVAVSLEQVELSAQDSPELSFDRVWARTVLQRVLEQLAAQYPGPKQALFEALRPGLTGEAVRPAEIAAQLGLGEGALKVAAHRLRKRFAERLRAEVAQTVASPSEVDEELRYLLSLL